MKRVLFIILTCLIIAGCTTTTKTVPIIYTHSPSTEFEILGTISIRSANSVGYDTVLNEAKKQFPSTDFVIDIMIDQHIITTSYHFITFFSNFFPQVFEPGIAKGKTRYEYTIHGTAIKYIRKNAKGEIITTPTPSATNIVEPSNIISAVGEIINSPSPAPTVPVSALAFPSNFIGTWKRNEYGNTLTFSSNSLQSSTSQIPANLVSISGDLYTLAYSNNSKFSITIKNVGQNLEISGGSGSGQGNWNGVWRKQ